MAAVHGGDFQPTAKPALSDWQQEGSSSGGFLNRGRSPPPGVTLPSVALLKNFNPRESSVAADLWDHMHKMVRDVTVSSSSKGSAPPSTATPIAGFDSAASESLNPLLTGSGLNQGDAPAAVHTDLQAQKHSGQHPGLAASLRLREHTSTSRQVRGAEEPPTEELVQEVTAAPVQTPPEEATSSPSSTQPTLATANTTNIPGGLAELNSTTDSGSWENGTDGTSAGLWSGNETTPSVLLFSNSSSAEEAPENTGNRSEAASTASSSFLNRQVPATTQDPLTPDNSSGPTFDSPLSRMTICLSRMDFVWIVLAISVPVSSCCKSTQDKQRQKIRVILFTVPLLFFSFITAFISVSTTVCCSTSISVKDILLHSVLPLASSRSVCLVQRPLMDSVYTEICPPDIFQCWAANDQGHCIQSLFSSQPPSCHPPLVSAPLQLCF